MIAYTNLLRCIENLGIAGAYGIRYYGQGKITHDNYIQFIRHFTLGDEYLDQSRNYVPLIGKGECIMFVRQILLIMTVKLYVTLTINLKILQSILI